MVIAVKEYKTVGELLKDKRQDEYYPGLAKRLAANDIEIPHLSRKIYLDEMNQLDRMAKESGGLWAQSVGGSRKNPKELTLTAEIPKGGFTHDERVVIKKALKEAGPAIPAVFADNFPGLTDLEARKAFNQENAIAAHLADSKSDPELDRFITEAAQKLGVPKPRLVVMESDLPSALAFSPPRIPSTIFIADDMLRIMEPSQVNAVLGHEMDHYYEKYTKEQSKQNRGIGAMIADMFYDFFAVEEKPYHSEYRADLRGDELAGMGQMEQALLRMHFRREELADFSDAVKKVLLETAKADKVDFTTAPEYLINLTDFDHARKHGEDKDPGKHFGESKKDVHPPLEWRRTNLKKGGFNKQDDPAAPTEWAIKNRKSGQSHSDGIV